jgi:hypothetical protein
MKDQNHCAGAYIATQSQHKQERQKGIIQAGWVRKRPVMTVRWKMTLVMKQAYESDQPARVSPMSR